MAARTLLLSVLIAVAAAMIPTLLADDDVHASEDWRTETVVDTGIDAVTASPAPASPAPAISEPASTDTGDRSSDEAVESTPAVVVTADLREGASADRGVRAIVVPAAAPVPVPAPAEVADQPAAVASLAEPVEPAPVEPLAARAEASAPMTAETAAVPAANAPSAPVPVAGYTIGDLVPQAPAPATANAGASVNVGAAMLPEGIDVDPNSDMVEILVSSVGQGGLFPAEIGPVDYSTDMVAIVIADDGMFPDGVGGDLSADMVELSAG